MKKKTNTNRGVSVQNRREFLKQAGGLAFTLYYFPKSISDSQHLETEALTKGAQHLHNSSVKKITILHTSDIHAQLLTHDEFFWENGQAIFKKRGGLAVLKTMLTSLKQENPQGAITIDGGDCFQGSGVAALSKGRAIVPLINYLQYDLMLPGNWEVVYGKEMMLEDFSAYHARKICANMYHDTNDQRNGDLIFPPYSVIELNGVKIGFIGYNDPLTAVRQSPAYSEGIRFTKPETNVAKYIKELKDDHQCQFIFLLTHMGLAQQIELGNQKDLEGAQHILGGDTHERVRQPIQAEYATVTEPGAFGSFVSKLEFEIENGKVKRHHYELLEVDPEIYKPDIGMLRLIDQAYQPYRSELNKVIGHTTTPLYRYFVLENPMDNMIADSLKWKFQRDIALSNGFRFCPPLVPEKTTGAAPITVDFLWNMLPVDSEVKTGSITGEQLWNWMEKELNNVFAKVPAERFGGWLVRFSGMEINFTAQKDYGQRLNYIKVKGITIEPRKRYSIVACERDGDPDNMLCRIKDVYDAERTGYSLHQVMKEYLGTHSPVAPVLEGRVTATDLPSQLLSQLEGYNYSFK